MSAKKYFSLDEANQLLPVLEDELHILQNIKQQFHDRFYELEIRKSMGHDETMEDVFLLECSLEFNQIEAQAHINNILATGAELKDIEKGLIDFPSKMNGEEILLCWKLGEPIISHYHSPQEGFAGRKSLFD